MSYEVPIVYIIMPANVWLMHFLPSNPRQKWSGHGDEGSADLCLSVCLYSKIYAAVVQEGGREGQRGKERRKEGWSDGESGREGGREGRRDGESGRKGGKVREEGTEREEGGGEHMKLAVEHTQRNQLAARHLTCGSVCVGLGCSQSRHSVLIRRNY